MKYKEDQNIDNLLSLFYREEASNMETPDSQRSWQEFRQLLEKGEHEQEWAGVSISPTKPGKKDSPYQFVRRYRNLTALAAACFILVMLLSGMPPVQTLRQVLTGSLHQPGADSAKLMDAEGMAEEDQLYIEPKDQPEDADERGRASTGTEGSGVESFGIMEQESAKYPPVSDEELLHPQSIPPTMEEPSPELATPGEARELTFATLEHYHRSLQEYRGFAPDKLFYLAAPPDGYRFSRGIITKTDTTLSRIRQEFTGPDGTKLIVEQTFLAGAVTMMDEATDRELGVYGDEGPHYHFHIQDGFNIMQWMRDDSTISVNAALDETSLSSISGHLVALD